MGEDFSESFETAGVTSVANPAAEPFGSGLTGPAGEQHYSPKELTHWGLSESKIRHLFEAEAGVLRIGEPSRRVGRKLRRSYITMRIPASVALRVYRRLNAGGRNRS